MIIEVLQWEHSEPFANYTREHCNQLSISQEDNEKIEEMGLICTPIFIEKELPMFHTMILYYSALYLIPNYVT